MKTVLLIVLINGLLIAGKPRPIRLKRAANLNPGFSLTKFRQDQLDLHNHYRKLHGAPLMTADSTLTTEAQSYAEYLAANNLFQHCFTTSCNSVGAGENLATAYGHTGVETNATYEWYKEVFYYDYCSFPNGRASNRPGHGGKQILHFTQVVWSPSTSLGIGYARSSDRTAVYVVARYSPAGNIRGQYSSNVPKAPYLLDKYQDNCFGVDGGFTAWSAPGACSKPCGKGVKFETRSCTNPKPSFNGRDCNGDTKRLHPYFCNSQACDTDVDERAQQCQERGYEPDAHNFGGTNECTLYCRDPTRSNFYLGRGGVDDGTLCQSGSGACINGACVTLNDEP